MKLTQEKVNSYVQSGGTSCPFCGSSDITGGDREINDGLVSQEVECETCGNYWQDMYKLYGIYDDVSQVEYIGERIPL